MIKNMEQVEAVKGGLAPEVEKLALALQRKSGRVGQLQERLLSRLRWGVARLQASHAAGVLRHALAGWRCVCVACEMTPSQPVSLNPTADPHPDPDSILNRNPGAVQLS